MDGKPALGSRFVSPAVISRRVKNADADLAVGAGRVEGRVKGKTELSEMDSRRTQDDAIDAH